MNSELALLDTSVWIHYLRFDGQQELKTAVKNALIEGRVLSCSVVRTEILVGSRDEKSFAKLSEHFEAVPDISIDATVWEGAARLGYTLRKKGITIPLPDLLIAEAAMQREAVLWHVDNHFEEICTIVPFHTRSFLPLSSG
jgi:predicted nucleic acid-binding protein